MSLKLLVTFDVKVDQVEAFVKTLQGAKSTIATAEGCEGVEVLVSEESPNKVVLSEIWTTMELHNQYAERMREAGSMDQMAARLNGPPTMDFYSIK